MVAARPHPSRLLRAGQRKDAPRDHPSAVPQMVIFVRSDLKLSTSKIATLAVHAAIYLYQKVCAKPNACTRWKNTGEKKAVLRIPGAEQMDQLIKAAGRQKLPSIVLEHNAKASGSPALKTAIGILAPSDIMSKLIHDVKMPRKAPNS